MGYVEGAWGGLVLKGLLWRCVSGAIFWWWWETKKIFWGFRFGVVLGRFSDEISLGVYFV